MKIIRVAAAAFVIGWMAIAAGHAGAAQAAEKHGQAPVHAASCAGCTYDLEAENDDFVDSTNCNVECDSYVDAYGYAGQRIGTSEELVVFCDREFRDVNGILHEQEGYVDAAGKEVTGFAGVLSADASEANTRAQGGYATVGSDSGVTGTVVGSTITNNVDDSLISGSVTVILRGAIESEMFVNGNWMPDHATSMTCTVGAGGEESSGENEYE